MNEVKVEKNDDEGPIPHIWRSSFKEIVKAFIKKDYQLNNPILNVTRLSKSTAEQIKEYIEGYGAELIELPEATWDTSVYIYSEGYWAVLIDLWTKDEGLSDLVIDAHVKEVNKEYVIEINLVYVP